MVEQTAMTGTLPDGRSVRWSPRGPHLSGDEDLVKSILRTLHRHAVDTNFIPLTATGPAVPAVTENKEAVFAAGNEATNHMLRWVNPPKVFAGGQDVVY